jgi:hypothetical protein
MGSVRPNRARKLFMTEANKPKYLNTNRIAKFTIKHSAIYIFFCFAVSTEPTTVPQKNVVTMDMAMSIRYVTFHHA